MSARVRHPEASRTEKWDRRFSSMAHLVSTWSLDPSTQVGAVIVDHRRIVRGVGYNGFPRGVRDDPERYARRELKYKLVVHAEANAILNSPGGLHGCTLYCTWHPCSACSALVIQAGIATVVCPEPDLRWLEEATLGKLMFEEAGVVVRPAP